MKKFFGGTQGIDSPRSNVGSDGNNIRLYQSNGSNSGGPFVAPMSHGPLSPRTPHMVSSSQQQQQNFEYFPGRASSPTPSSLAPTIFSSGGMLAPVQNIASAQHASPGTSAQLPDSQSSPTNMQAHAVERTDLHKGLKTLEGLLVTFDEYRELKGRLAKCEKRLAKGLMEVSKSKVFEDVPSQTLQSSAMIFDSIIDTTTKHAKLVQKEYEAMNQHCAKYFKAVAKEERAHDELLDTLDSKVKKAHASHEKNSKKAGRVAIELHDKYIQAVQSLTQEIGRAKSAHSASVGTKTYVTSLVVACTLGGVADSEFKALCENVRKSGPHVGKLNEWLNFAATDGMTQMQPLDLNDDAMGWAQVLAIREAEIREEMNKQEQARLVALEKQQAMLKAQQMGWTPPSRQPSESPQQRNSVRDRSSMAMLNLPRLDSEGQLVEADFSGTKLDSADQGSQRNEQAEAPRSRSASIRGEDKDVEPVHEHKLALLREDEENDGDQTHPSHDSSIVDGTVIDRGEATTKPAEEPIKEETASPQRKNAKISTAREDSHATGTSQSKASDDSSTNEGSSSKSHGPPTPVDEQPMREVTVVSAPTYLRRPEFVEEPEAKVERPLDRYVDSSAPKQLTLGKGTPLARVDSISERTRKLSLWEHEKERERQLERETELQRRLMEAEDRLRNMDRENPASGRVSKGNEMITSHAMSASRPRYSEPSRSYGTTRNEEEIPAQRYEPERYAPAVGTSRLSSHSVHRTLRTDSERSFVARMKVKYQAEKEERSNVPYPPPANRYMASARAPEYGSNSYDLMATSLGRGRYDSAPSRAADDRTTPSHAVGCGCWSCSARHYGGDAKIKAGYNPTPPPRHPSAQLQQAPPNHRRQSMPPVRDDRSTMLTAPTPPQREMQTRRSFEGEDRRVAFANSYQTVR